MKIMTRVRSSNSRCSDLVRYMLGAASVSSNFSDKFCGYDGEAYNEDVNIIFLDFENCMPTESERHLFQMLERVLDDAFRLETDIAEYSNGATAHIKRALQNSSNVEIQNEVFQIVCSFVARIKAYYELAQRIEQILPNLLWDLCSGPLPPAEQIDSSQALCKQLAHIVDFVFRFDCLKMCTPALQNDFSFYRRVLSRTSDLSSDLARHSVPNQLESTILATSVVSLELANTISLFLANPTPMLNSLSHATVAFVRDHPDLPVTNTTETLTTVIQICRHMLERKDFYDKISAETRDFVLRVMVGSLILFDHIDESSNTSSSSTRNGGGAFSRSSPIDLRAIIRLIKMNDNEQRVEQLMNALRYTSKHFNDADTPKSIRALFN